MRMSHYPFVIKRKFNLCMPPNNPHEEVTGLKEAIEATKKRVAKHKADDVNVTEFEMHLKSLEQQLEAAQKKIKTAD